MSRYPFRIPWHGPRSLVQKKNLDYMNKDAKSLKIPVGFWHLYGKKSHKSGLIIDLLVKHLLVCDPKRWVSGNGIKKFLFD